MNLSKPQFSIYHMEKYAGGSISNICCCLLRDGSLNYMRVNNAINQLIFYNDILRCRISETEKGPNQSISEYKKKNYQSKSFNTYAEFIDYANAYASVPIHLYDQLYKIIIVSTDTQYGILIKLHHIIGDAWTMALLVQQFTNLLEGKQIQTESYFDYLKTEQSYLQGNRYQKDKLFFMQKFKQWDDIQYFSAGKGNDFSSDRISKTLTEKETHLIKNLAERCDCSVFSVLITIFSIYYSKLKMNTEHLCIGTPIINRTGMKQKNTAGMFINTVPLGIDLYYNESFDYNLHKITDMITASIRHQRFQYEDLLTELRNQSSQIEALFDVVISYQNIKIKQEDIEIVWFHCKMQTESLQIHIHDYEDKGKLSIDYDYRLDKLTVSEIESMHNHLVMLLSDIARHPEAKISEFNFLTDNEERLLNEFNQTEQSYHKNIDVCQMIEEQAKLFPNRFAIIDNDKKITYQCLLESANRMGNALIKKGIANHDIIAVILPKSTQFIIAVLGVLKSGAAYLPIAPDLPHKRMETILSNNKIKMIINEHNIHELLLYENSDNVHKCSINDRCYCICTSGSTGQPKTVAILHRNLMHYVYNLKELYQISHINMPFFTSQSVDLTVTSIYLPLISGGTIYVYHSELETDLREIMNNNAITMLKITPTHMQIMNKLLKDKLCKNLQHVIVGGENLASKDAKTFRNKFGTHIQIHNEYGPTETTVGCTDYVFHENEDSDFVSIGHPFKNTKLFVLDRFLKQLPIGIIGELYILGDGVGNGYLNQPQLTDEKFIRCPFDDNKTMYKTGDLVYRQADGNLMYVGRNDFQVKLHGLRIELSEIEQAICQVEGIAQAVVEVRSDERNRQYLCAFYVENDLVDQSSIMNKIKVILPRYMIPQILMKVDNIPISPSGKVNRKALPHIELDKITASNAYVAPKTEMQKELVKILEDTLCIHPIGICDNFFELGADSLKMIEFSSKAQTEGYYFKLQSVFDHPSIQELDSYMHKCNTSYEIYSDMEFLHINESISHNVVAETYKIQESNLGNLFLTGATGYLGIHLLAEYLEQERGCVYCLVRGKDKNDCQKRLKTLMNDYFGNKYDSCFISRIKVVTGDLCEDYFGLNKNEYEYLIKNIQTVIHAAASVKHYGSYQFLKKINVDSTDKIIDFTKQADARLIYISTMSVSGTEFEKDANNHLKEVYFSENQLYIHQRLDNVYVRSKFEAEKAVIEAISQGLRAIICRIGNLVNRYSDGVFQYNYESNAFVNRIKAMIELGVIPEYLSSINIDFTPVDEASVAIMQIIRHVQAPYNVFHIINNHHVQLKELLCMLESVGIHIRLESHEVFKDCLQKTMNQSNTKSIYESFVSDLDEQGKLNFHQEISVHYDFTIDYLKSLSFEWSEINVTFIKKYIAFFKNKKYIE